MECPRCKGMMFEDRFQDVKDEAGQMSFEGYRCPACGEVLDPVILKNRSLRSPVTPGRKRRRLIPVGIS